MTSAGTSLVPGRTLPRRTYQCASCGARAAVGEPKGIDSWPPSVKLSSAQVRLLLVAAAEYRDLAEDAGEYEHAVQFVDWVVGCLNHRASTLP